MAILLNSEDKMEHPNTASKTPQRIVVIGGNAGGTSFVAQARRRSPTLTSMRGTESRGMAVISVNGRPLVAVVSGRLLRIPRPLATKINYLKCHISVAGG